MQKKRFQNRRYKICFQEINKTGDPSFSHYPKCKSVIVRLFYIENFHHNSPEKCNSDPLY